MTQQYMLLFSLGPVQAFIAQARKTRDLWLGSFLLSALMQASMQNVKDKLIFPSNPTIDGNIPDLPNKYIAIFSTLQEAEQAARQSEDHIVKTWKDICDDVWNKVFKDVRGIDAVTHRQWGAQINPINLFELYWVVVAGDDDNKYYKDWLKATQTLFDQRKHLRNFEQQLEIGEKSTISGQRAALRGVGEWRTDVQTFWYNVAKEQRSLRDISKDGTERLDAVDTVKRFAHLSDTLAQLVGHKNSQDFEAGFPSTSSIATASFIEQLLPASESPDVAPALSTWLRESSKLNEAMPATIPLLAVEAKKYRRGTEIIERDGDCYFPETYSARRLEKEFGFDNEHKAEREQLAKNGPDAVQKLLRATDAITSPVTRPTPYYAMIQMDGDKMGRLINGVGSRGEHQAISRALSDFSRKNVPHLVEKGYPGRLIYAGGDDVFALAPLGRDIVPDDTTTHSIKNVLNLVYQLQAEYHNVVEKEVVNTPAANSKDPSAKSRTELVTASTGIAIAHHYTSLSYVRRVSKEAEQLAKNSYGRNALVVTVLRRSGEQTRVGCHWHYDNLSADAQPIELFSSFYDLFVEDVLSPKCVHTLLEEAPTLVALEEGAQASEIRRVLTRQRNPMKEERLTDDELLLKAQHIVKLAQAMNAENQPDKEQDMSVELHAEGKRYGLVEVLGWLLVVLFLARKEQE